MLHGRDDLLPYRFSILGAGEQSRQGRQIQPERGQPENPVVQEVLYATKAFRPEERPNDLHERSSHVAAFAGRDTDAFSRKGDSSRWLATGSMTRPRWLKRKSESPWEQALMWPWRAQESRW